jgi:hypothetical protein
MIDENKISFTNVESVIFHINQETQGYTKKGSLDITLFWGGGYHRSFYISAKGNELVIREGMGYCPYIPEISLPKDKQIFESKVGYKKRLNYDK